MKKYLVIISASMLLSGCAGVEFKRMYPNGALNAYMDALAGPYERPQENETPKTQE